MESRILLSAVVASVTAEALPTATPDLVRGPRSGGKGVTPLGYTSPSGLGYTVNQMRGGYGLGAIGSSNISFYNPSSGTYTPGDGTGQTIALIDYYNDPDITTDLATFDAAEGLSAPPSFQVLNQSGQTSPLPSNSPTSGNSDWSSEESLDVEWAHAMAPGASLILIECSSSLESGDAEAASLPGVSVVSNSWGSSESSNESSSLDPYFTTPSGHSNVAFFASTGDTGAEISYPAESPNVVAVGGTALTLSSNNWSSETTWSSGGGGTSKYERQPSYQTGTITATYRETPDISMDASPNTGVPIVDSWDNSASAPWSGVWGGTSLSSPMMAALVSIADQGRSIEGLASTLTTAQVNTRLYQLSKANFHDIVTGSNGHAAVTGYDEATGIGSPIANVLIPDLAGAATITGRIFVDDTGTGVYGGNDLPLSGRTVYLDLNNDGSLDNSEPYMTTNAQGTYTFTDEPAGGTVRLSAPTIAGYIALPVASASMSYGVTTTVNFTYFPTSFTNTAASTNFTLQTNPLNTVEQILVNNTLQYSIAKSLLGSTALTFSLTGADDSFTVNGANGSPVPSGGITVTGAAPVGLPLTVIGVNSGIDAFIATSTSLSFDGNPISFSSGSPLTLNPGNGTDALTVNSGSVSIAAQTPGGGILKRNFSTITIAADASASFLTAAQHSDRTLVQVGGLFDAGTLDLGGNDMIVQSGNLAVITALLASGYNGGQWTGAGIASAAAATDTTHLTALGAIASGLGQLPFDGVNPLPSDVLIKYTYYGDADLTGSVDGTDYSRIDNGSLFGQTGWYNGDFNYDTQIDGSDYSLIDNSYNTQGSPL